MICAVRTPLGQQSFAVTVPEANRAPEPVGSMPALTVSRGVTATLDISAYFSDPNGDALTYAASSSDSTVAPVSVSGADLTVSAAAAGAATVTVTATDPGGLAARQGFRVTVPISNQAPQPVSTIRDLIPVEDTAQVEAPRYFEDPDGDLLTYTVETSEAVVAFGYVTGSKVTVAAAGEGIATLTVTARDPDGLSAQQSFRAAVGNMAPHRIRGIPDLLLAVGETARLDASAFFGDPDGDGLTYATRIWSGIAVSALASGSALTVRAATQGDAEFVVEANDGQHTARDYVDVTVAAVAPPDTARYERKGTTMALNRSASAGATHYRVPTTGSTTSAASLRPAS